MAQINQIPTHPLGCMDHTPMRELLGEAFQRAHKVFASVAILQLMIFAAPWHDSKRKICRQTWLCSSFSP